MMKNQLNTDMGTYKPFIWQPPIDIYQEEQGWLVKMELAGVRSTDVDISIVGDNLLIRGKRKDFTIQRNQKIYSMEIAYSQFQRSIGFPGDLGNVEIITDFRDGMIFVHLKMENIK